MIGRGLEWSGAGMSYLAATGWPCYLIVAGVRAITKAGPCRDMAGRAVEKKNNSNNTPQGRLACLPFGAFGGRAWASPGPGDLLLPGTKWAADGGLAVCGRPAVAVVLLKLPGNNGGVGSLGRLVSRRAARAGIMGGCVSRTAEAAETAAAAAAAASLTAAEAVHERRLCANRASSGVSLADERERRPAGLDSGLACFSFSGLEAAPAGEGGRKESATK